MPRFETRNSDRWSSVDERQRDREQDRRDRRAEASAQYLADEANN